MIRAAYGASSELIPLRGFVIARTLAGALGVKCFHVRFRPDPLPWHVTMALATRTHGRSANAPLKHCAEVPFPEVRSWR